MDTVKRFVKDSICLRFLYMLIIYWPLFFVSGLVKRDEEIWLISCQHGFIDNPKYFYIYYHDYLKSNYNIQLFWLASTQNQFDHLVSLGFKNVVLKKTFKGFFLCLKAKIYLTSYGFHEFFQLCSKGAYVVNLWHGVGIKNIVFKGDVEPLVKKALAVPFSKLIYPSLYRKYDLFLSTSDLMVEHFSECFVMNKDKFFISDYPRCKPLTMSASELQHFIDAFESDNIKKLASMLCTYNKVFIYMPTWRDSNPGFLTEVDIDWIAINEALRIDRNVLILKIHPACSVSGLNNYSNIILLDRALDIYPILPFTDCLITDYSSIYFDYLLTDKNIALFTFDYYEYLSECRDFAYPYDENMIGFRINSVSEFTAFFEGYGSVNFDQERSRIESIKNKFWSSGPDLTKLIDRVILETK